MQILRTFGIIGLLITVGMACTKEPQLAPWDNPNLSDSTGVFVPVDLFINGSMDGNGFSYEHNKRNYQNERTASQIGYCTQATDTFPSFIEMQSMLFRVPDKLRRSIYIDLVRCIPDNEEREAEMELLYEPGYYPYMSSVDSSYGVQVRYIDSEGTFWSTMYGPNDMAGSDFQLSGVIENKHDTLSTRIAFGRFSCVLYNDKSEIIRMRDCEFKSRIGTY